MCGIVGYVGRGHRAMDVLIDGLRRLEYRGYDSAGVAIFDQGEIQVRRALGKLAQPRRASCATSRWPGRSGSATRAGPPTASPRSATPTRTAPAPWWSSTTASSRTTAQLRQELEAAGRTIASDTDTELIAHLIDVEVGAGERPARRRCAPPARRLDGSYAFAALSARRSRTTSSPPRTAAARSSSASARSRPSSPATSRRSCPTRARCSSSRTASSRCSRRTACRSSTRDGRPARARAQADPVGPGLGGEGRLRPLHAEGDLRAAARDHRHDRDARGRAEEPTSTSTASTSRRSAVDAHPPHRPGRLRHGLLRLHGRQVPARADRAASRPTSTSPASSATASRSSTQSCLVVPVSQSGETADTLAALRQGKAGGARVISICNVRDSTIARESDDVLYTHAGPEIGVASTKAFTTQIVALYLLALKLGIARGAVERAEARRADRAAAAAAAPARADAPARRRRAEHRPEVLPRQRTSSSSAAASCTRSRSRARSSSRRSPTSTPRATPPAR